MFKKIRTKKVYMKIVEQILELIKDGKLLPGDKLPSEKLLTQEFAASRSSIREALSALEVLGVIGRIGGKENFIRNDISPSLLNEKIQKLKTEESPSELLEIRTIIEPESAGLAAERRTSKDLEKLEKNVMDMKNVSNIFSSHMLVCIKFHLEVAKASHNSIILSVMYHISGGMKQKLWESLEKRTLKDKTDYIQHYQEHIDILNAIKDRNNKLSKEVMLNHLIKLRKDLFNKEDSL